MEHIIQQIALELARKITERTLFDEIYDLDLMSSLALEDCKAAAIKIIEVLIENINVAFREDKASRLEKGILIKEHDRHRDVFTELGRIGFDRDYYYDRNRKCYVSPIDKLLNVSMSVMFFNQKTGIIFILTKSSYQMEFGSLNVGIESGVMK